MPALDDFAAQVGADGPVTIAGLSTRGGPVAGVRCVAAPSGIDWIQADEMTLCCGAGTPVDEVSAALAAVGQRLALPAGGTVGGALAVGRSGIRRLGDGPARDTLLQARYVSAGGEVVKAGGPTVKNVSGFDLCRLLVGSHGTLGFLGEVILRTKPLPLHSQWFSGACVDPSEAFRRLYRPVSVLFDGAYVWALLEGHPADVAAQAAAAGLAECAGPPSLGSKQRRVLEPSVAAAFMRSAAPGSYVAELGVGVLHLAHDSAAPCPQPTAPSSGALAVSSRMKQQFDPAGRLNPGVVVG